MFISNLLAGSVPWIKAMPYMQVLWFAAILIGYLRTSRTWAVDQTPPLCVSVVTETILSYRQLYT